jgi:hypothetical protein
MLQDHPGYLGWTSQGVVLIHADWPMYPAEHGWQVALLSLGQFPVDTIFREIDNIDQCFLFFVGNPAEVKDAFDEQYFHVAAWHEDIVDLFRASYVSGASEITREEWIDRRCKELEGLFWKRDDGTYVPVPKPDPEDFVGEVESTVLMISDDGLKITPTGWQALEEILVGLRPDLHPVLAQRALPIADLGYYDAAVREGCVLLESRLKEIVASTKYGQALVSQFFTAVERSGKFIPAQTKVLRSEVRTTFKFVRNDYMHNLREIGAEQCYAILARISRLMFGVHQFESVLSRQAGA